MPDPFSQIAQAITDFVSAIIMKGGEEIGKNIGSDLYQRIKKIFKKDKASSVLQDLETNPSSKKAQENFENELIEVLMNTNNFSKDIVYVLTIMSVDAAILETIFKSYKKLKYEHDLYYIEWTQSMEESENLEERIKKLEQKMFILQEKVMAMLNREQIS